MSFETCDQCGGQAVRALWAIVHPNSVNRTHLTFCNHHKEQHFESLTAQGYRITNIEEVELLTS